MLTMIEKLKSAARNQMRYRQTRAELARLPLDSRLDLDIHDVNETARRAIWG
ncbi:MAG TPA: hypothetical protein VGA75_10570 [Paracoccaceae bacterium]